MFTYINLNTLCIQTIKIKLVILAMNNLIKSYYWNLQGAVPKGNATKEMIQHLGLREGQVIYKCPKCCCIKPSRAHHCSVCQRFTKIILITKIILHSQIVLLLLDVLEKWTIIVHGSTIVLEKKTKSFLYYLRYVYYTLISTS